MTSIESKKLSGKLEEAIEKLRFSMVAPLVADKVDLLKKRYPYEKVVMYLEEVFEAAGIGPQVASVKAIRVILLGLGGLAIARKRS